MVSKFHPHTCLEVLTVKAKSTSTAYSAEQLVRVVLPLIKRDPNITSTKVGEALYPSIVKLAPPKSLLHSVKNKALQVHNGDVNKQVGMLPALCAALSDEGHMTRVHYMDGRNMRVAIHDRLRTEHEFSQKNKAKVSLKPPPLPPSSQHENALPPTEQTCHCSGDRLETWTGRDR